MILIITLQVCIFFQTTFSLLRNSQLYDIYLLHRQTSCLPVSQIKKRSCMCRSLLPVRPRYTLDRRTVPRVLFINCSFLNYCDYVTFLLRQFISWRNSIRPSDDPVIKNYLSDKICACLAQLIPSSQYIQLRGSFALFKRVVELILILDTVEFEY